MPTDTFFRLPEEKRARLIHAIDKELARVPVAEMSVNRIVHNAAISRGSFYQYFSDREDLTRFLVDRFLMRLRTITDTEAAECADCFVLLRRFVQKARMFCDLPENRARAANLLSHLRIRHSAYGSCIHATPIDTKAMMDWYDRYFARSTLNADSDETFGLMLELLFALLCSAMAEIYAPNADADLAIARFEHKLEILRRGMVCAAGRE